jgi:hypothetical protein
MLTEVFGEHGFKFGVADSTDVVCILYFWFPFSFSYLGLPFLFKTQAAPLVKNCERLHREGYRVIVATDIPYGTTNENCDPIWSNRQLLNWIRSSTAMAGKTGVVYAFCSDSQHQLLADIFAKAQSKAVSGNDEQKAAYAHLLHFVCPNFLLIAYLYLLILSSPCRI